MSGFQAVNSTLGVEHHYHHHHVEATTPTTPRPVHASTASPHQPPQQLNIHSESESSPITPTRNSFGILPSQRPLPTSIFSTPPSYGDPSAETKSKRDSSTISRDPHDTHMNLDDSEDDLDGSENESVADESGRPSKKKKGQRFFCTDFPPCQLSFTRSEHLARHIRYVSSAATSSTSSHRAHLSVQKTYRRAPVPMSLRQEILQTRQSAATCTDGACQ